MIIEDESEVAEYCVWDFSGLEEFGAAHDLFVTDRGGLYLVVCSLGPYNPRTCKVEATSNSKLREQYLKDWLDLISRQPSSSYAHGHGQILTSSRPYVIVACSHKDFSTVSKEDADFDSITEIWTSNWGKEMVQKYSEIFKDKLQLHPEVFVLDCRASQSFEMKALRNCLVEQHLAAAMKQRGEVFVFSQKVLFSIPSIRIQYGRVVPAEKLKLALLDIHKPPREYQENSPDYIEKYKLAMEDVICYLHSVGEVFYWTGAEGKWVILDPQWFIQNVVGKLLARTAHRGIIEMIEGRISRFALETIFGCVPCNDSSAVVDLLCALKICFPLDAQASTFLVPAQLRVVPNLTELFHSDGPYSAFSGYRVSVGDEQNGTGAALFNTDFFSHVQMHAYRKVFCAESTNIEFGQRLIRLKAKNGCTDCIVHLNKENRWVDIWVRGTEETERTCISLCDHIVQILQEVQSEIYAGRPLSVMIVSEQQLMESLETQ